MNTFKKIIKNNFLMLKYVNKYCPNHKWITMVKSILTSTTSVIVILLQKYTIDLITNGVKFSFVICIILSSFLIMIITSLINNYFENVIIAKNSQILFKGLQVELFNKAKEVDLNCYDNRDFYNKYTLALHQADTRALAVLDTFSSLIGSLFGITSLIVLIVAFKPILLIIVLINVLISFYLQNMVSKINHRLYEERNYFTRQTEYTKRIFYLREFAKDLRLFEHLSSLLVSKFRLSVEEIIQIIRKYGKKSFRLGAIQSIISRGSQLIILLYLAYNVFIRKLTIGDYIALSNSSLQLEQQLNQFISSFQQMYEHNFYIENFKDFINFKSEITENETAKEIIQYSNIKLVNVSFIYPTSNNKVIDNINMEIKKGEKIAIVGRNGVGKSTLINLITRLYDPTEGKLILNDNEYKDYKLSELRNLFGVINQDYQHFSATIQENILMRTVNNVEADNFNTYEALRKIGLYEKVNNLPNNINADLTTEFSDTGAMFSGGELQKIAIARLFLKEAEIIILDEPSSSLDAISEREIFNIVLDEFRSKTIIMISHRLANIKNADKIYFFENGVIKEMGTHEQLMSLKKDYYNLYITQAQGYTNQDLC